MSDALPGWLPGREPENFGPATWIPRSRLIADSTLTDRQVRELVATGRLTPRKMQANRKVTLFALSEINGLFEVIPADEA